MATVVKAMEDADVVLLGETHDDRIAHLLQLQLLRGAQDQSSRCAREDSVGLPIRHFKSALTNRIYVDPIYSILALVQDG